MKNLVGTFSNPIHIFLFPCTFFVPLHIGPLSLARGQKWQPRKAQCLTCKILFFSCFSSEVVKYDRIVCDVPCSGDGTIRKNPNVWNDWSPARGNARHMIQFNIAERGVELLEVGGIMAYSSCAINPIENEAVIAR